MLNRVSSCPLRQSDKPIRWYLSPLLWRNSNHVSILGAMHLFVSEKSFPGRHEKVIAFSYCAGVYWIGSPYCKALLPAATIQQIWCISPFIATFFSLVRIRIFIAFLFVIPNSFSSLFSVCVKSYYRIFIYVVNFALSTKFHRIRSSNILDPLRGLSYFPIIVFDVSTNLENREKIVNLF